MAGFMDPDAALDHLQAMQRAREAYGDAPEPEFAAAIINHAATSGLHAMFVRTVDESGAMIWQLEVKTGRGFFALRRPGTIQTWREFLGSDPIAVDLGLLPPDAPRA